MRRVNKILYRRGSAIANILISDYYGPRTAKGLTDFAKENMENKVIRLTDDTLSSFLTNNVP